MTAKARATAAASTRSVPTILQKVAPALALALGVAGCDPDSEERAGAWEIDPEPVVEIGTLDEPGPCPPPVADRPRARRPRLKNCTLRARNCTLGVKDCTHRAKN